ncbi:MAG: response regulator [Myxococcales bacterium]|nr:response regulator [Myxococcales bacterium]
MSLISHESNPSQPPLRILVVDDDDAVRGVIKRVLERLGHQVEACASASEAEARCNCSTDVAMIDLHLGDNGEDGWAVLERCKLRYPKTCFILTSGARPDLPHPAHGGPLFLRKPFSRAELVNLLETVRAKLANQTSLL